MNHERLIPNARKREALSLIEKGVADTLLIPAWRKMIRYDGSSRKPLEKKTVMVAGRPQVSVNFFGRRPTAFESYGSLGCLQSAGCRKHVVTEYLKIAWFLVYSWFV